MTLAFLCICHSCSKKRATSGNIIRTTVELNKSNQKDYEKWTSALLRNTDSNN